LASELEKRSTSMSIFKSKYCKIILQQWLDSGKKLTISEQGLVRQIKARRASRLSALSFFNHWKSWRQKLQGTEANPRLKWLAI